MSSRPVTVSDLGRVHTLADLLTWRAVTTPQREAYRQHDAASGRWVSWTWGETQRQVTRWRAALLASGVTAGERVGILVPNGLDHVCMDLAALSLGLVPVPMHAVDNPQSVAYILSDSDAAVLLVDSVARWQSIAGAGQPLPGLRQVIVQEAVSGPVEAPQPARVAQRDAWLDQGVGAAGVVDLPAPMADTLAAIVYTSGTTGKPKGVMLTHGNVVANIKAVLQRFVVTPDDVLLSFLPLSHTFERTVGYYLPIAAGACVVYARSVALLQEDLVQVRPTVLVSVPRIYERVHAKVMEAIHQQGGVKRRLLEMAEVVGWRRFLASQGRSEVTLTDRLIWPALHALVAQKVLGAFGGRLRMAIAGGAPLSDAVARFYLGLGLTLLQGYGMTETSPVVSCNTPDDNDPASVGRPLPGVQVRIGENNELLVAGPTVMQGYWKRPEDTQRVLEPDGWLHTGDQARLTEGRLYIVGRIKDIIVTSTGEKIAPSDLELAIQADPLFAQVLVIGEQRPFLSVLAVVNPSVWASAARAAGLDPDAPGALDSGEARQMALQRIVRLVSAFPSYAVPKQVRLLADPWTIDAGLMTPTLKLKRPALMHHHADLVDALYAPRR